MIKKGDYVEFGSYFKTSENKREPIEWLVLAEKEDRYLLLSKFVIDAMAYDNEPMKGNVTWEISTLRRWLNSDFFKASFTSKEKESIIEILNNNKDYHSPLKMKLPGMWAQFAPSTDISGGNKTKDKIFLLSWEEGLSFFKRIKDSDHLLSMLKAQLKHFEPYDMEEVAVALEGLRAQPTPYAEKKKAYVTKKEEGAWWWLRSPGGTGKMASGTMNGDILYHGGCDVDDETMGVRPACWVKKDAFLTEDELKEIERENLMKKEKAEREKLIKLQNERKSKGLCPYCGGTFKGFFMKTCSKCGKKKDY